MNVRYQFCTITPIRPNVPRSDHVRVLYFLQRGEIYVWKRNVKEYLRYLCRFYIQANRLMRISGLQFLFIHGRRAINRVLRVNVTTYLSGTKVFRRGRSFNNFRNNRNFQQVIIRDVLYRHRPFNFQLCGRIINGSTNCRRKRTFFFVIEVRMFRSTR